MSTRSDWTRPLWTEEFSWRQLLLKVFFYYSTWVALKWLVAFAL